MSKTNNLTDFLTAEADAIRSKKGYPPTQKINPQDFADEIASINTVNAQAKAVSPTTSLQLVTPDAGYNALSRVAVAAISPTKAAQTYTPTTSDQVIPAGRWLIGNQTVKGDPNFIPANIKKGTAIFGVTGTYGGDDFDLKTRYQAPFSPTSATTFKFNVTAQSTDEATLRWDGKTATVGDGETVEITIGDSRYEYQTVCVNFTDYVYEFEISLGGHTLVRMLPAETAPIQIVLVFYNGDLFITSTKEVHFE